jgi:hypothetical protein
VDVNECQGNPAPCDSLTDCENIPGSFECTPCPDVKKKRKNLFDLFMFADHNTKKKGYGGDGRTGCFPLCNKEMLFLYSIGWSFFFF